MHFILLLYHAGGISWDWVNQKLYWTDPCQDDIEVFDPNTSFRKVLFNNSNGLRNPAEIIVDPTTRFVYAAKDEQMNYYVLFIIH